MKPVIYQLVVRYFGNTNITNQANGAIGTNGCGKFADISDVALQKLRGLGVTHLWLTGVIRQATLTDYTAQGLPPDDADVVKGIAGSFYAVRDYYDVCPDYAVNPAQRLQEFDALVGRIHAAQLQVIIDLVPNHVSRDYSSVIKPQESFGRGDDTTQFFSAQNHFYYLVDPANQVLRLAKPPGWNPPGVNFDGLFAPEDGSPGHPPKATGNNVTSPSPSAGDWYETIKLNYGYNFVNQQHAYDPQPRTWQAVDAILAYWQNKGVDGFRCDFAHYVPAEAWTFLITQARTRRAAFFFGEAYPWGDSGDPVKSLEVLIQAGFDAVYHYQSYNALKDIYTHGRMDEYDNEMKYPPVSQPVHLLHYLENHDERRVASPVVGDKGPGDSGFGSAGAGRQLAPLQFLYGNGPVMLLNGQEVGEPGSGAEGFGGDDGRTTIYDYWTMPEFAKWVNHHLYDGGGLSDFQKGLRKYYADLMALCQHPCITGDRYWSLWYFNHPSVHSDCPAGLYSFARFQAGSGSAIVVVANFQPGSSINGPVRIPSELSTAAGLDASVTVELILDAEGAKSSVVGTWTTAALASQGFPVSVPDQTTQVYLLRPV